jgi:hypothetical protein
MKKNLIFISAFVIAITLFVSCRKEVKSVIDASDSPTAISVSPATAAGNNIVTVSGTGMGDITNIVFEKDNVPATFNPVFNTGEAIVFRVPDTASGGPQKIIFTNRLGKTFTVDFNVIALPLVKDVSNYNFQTGTVLTLTGINLEAVSKVVLTESPTTNVTIVSKTKKELVISMPATTLFRSKLDITNTTGTITTSQEFVSLANNFKFFSEGYDNGEQDASWGDPGFISTTVSKSGTSSFGKNFQAGNWHQMGFGWNNISNNGYSFLSFYMKGGTKDIDIWIFTDQTPGGNGPFANDNQKITIPANVWTYFRIPISSVNLWAGGAQFNQIGWRLQGPNGGDEKLYLDDVMLVK